MKLKENMYWWLLFVCLFVCVCLCACTHTFTEVCFDCVLVSCFVIGYVLQFQEKHAEEYIIFIISNPA